MNRIGIGLIGCGTMGMALAERVLALDPRLEIRGIHDPDERSIASALKALEAQPGYTAQPPALHPTYESLLADPEIHWVMIASWNCFHCEQTLAALQAGKHIFCQKPLGITLDECLQMNAAWRSTDRLFNIGFTLRYSPHYRTIRQLITEGAIGELISMEFNETLDFSHGGYIMGDWRRLQKNAGTHLLEKCCHDIDLANWMIGSRASRAASFGGLRFYTPENAFHATRIGTSKEGKPAYRSWTGLCAEDPFEADKDIIDHQVAILEYANGVRASFHTNCNSALPERRMVLLGSEGTIIADVVSGSIRLRRIGFETEVENCASGAHGGHGDGDGYLARELADSMLYGNAPSSGMKEGLESAITCFAIDHAMQTGAVVDLSPYWAAVDQGTSSPLMTAASV